MALYESESGGGSLSVIDISNLITVNTNDFVVSEPFVIKKVGNLFYYLHGGFYPKNSATISLASKTIFTYSGTEYADLFIASRHEAIDSGSGQSRIIYLDPSAKSLRFTGDGANNTQTSVSQYFDFIVMI
jgi:hypothetical protein